MTTAAQITLRLLRQLEKHDTEASHLGEAASQREREPSLGVGEVSSAEMLQALVDSGFDLNAAIVRLRRDA